MKRNLLFILLLSAIAAFGQTTTIVQWTFPDSTLALGANSDGGLPINIGIPITTNGGTNAISFNHNGLTSYCARATGWNAGSGTKYWLVHFSTINYNTLKLSSKQESATSTHGPRDFKVQYTTSLLGNWTDVPLAIVNDSDDWVHGAITDIDLPAACDDQDSVFLRWIMTSNNSISGDPVQSGGPNKIDDIIITGVSILSSVQSFANQTDINICQDPSNKTINILSNKKVTSINVYDIIGNLVYYCGQMPSNIAINTSNFRKGVYILKVLFDDNTLETRKVLF